MSKSAYRFVPLENDAPVESARYTIVSDRHLALGDEVALSIRGFEIWEVMQLKQSSRPLVGASDARGEDIPLVGTIVCRGVR
jgi:hypothetical protein